MATKAVRSFTISRGQNGWLTLSIDNLAHISNEELLKMLDSEMAKAEDYFFQVENLGENHELKLNIVQALRVRTLPAKSIEHEKSALLLQGVSNYILKSRKKKFDFEEIALSGLTMMMPVLDSFINTIQIHHLKRLEIGAVSFNSLQVERLFFNGIAQSTIETLALNFNEYNVPYKMRKGLTVCLRDNASMKNLEWLLNFSSPGPVRLSFHYYKALSLRPPLVSFTFNSGAIPSFDMQIFIYFASMDLSKLKCFDCRFSLIKLEQLYLVVKALKDAEKLTIFNCALLDIWAASDFVFADKTLLQMLGTRIENFGVPTRNFILFTEKVRRLRKETTLTFY